LEPLVEPCFHDDSYGYRPGKSAHDALGVARQRCWRYDWVLDLDIKSFFDSIDRDKLMMAVRKHSDCRWVLLYIERWLRAPMQLADGSLVERERGTPQGGVISPLLANLFLHYTFDEWMRRNHPDIPFERYADDVICHCRSEAQAQTLRDRLEERFADCGLVLHPEKTKIVYCKDDNRPGDYPNQSFDFLGYTFRPRRVKWPNGQIGVGFTPAISNKALKEIRQTVRRWALPRHSEASLEGLAELINPAMRGWINYYGRFGRSALGPIYTHVNNKLAWWAYRKFKTLKRSREQAYDWLRRIKRRQPGLFAHWQAHRVIGRTTGAV
jgi:group II intron reverse transcriptase/maturase